MNRTALLLCLALLASPITSAREIPPVYWPDAARPALTIVSLKEEFDGVPITVNELAGAGLRIRLDSTGGWIRSGEVSPEFSVLLGHPASEDVRLGFALFAPDEFLNDLAAERWSAYLRGLQTKHAGNLSAVAEGGNIDGTAGMFVFGQPYRDVSFNLAVGPRGQPVSRREVFVMVNGRLLVIVLEGPPSVTPGLAAPLQRFLARLELKS